MPTSNQRMYLSGQITGLSVEVYERNFDAAAYLAKVSGWEPVNPVTLSPVDEDCACRWKGYHPDSVIGKHAWKCYLKRDLREMLTCQSILMLDGWEVSPGARLENFVAINCGLWVYRVKLGRIELA